MSYKLIAFDMDGTLLNSEKKLTPATLAAISEAVSQGKIVALSTGRCLPELYEYIPELTGVRYLICVSGGYIYDVEKKGFVYKNALSDEYVQQIMEVAGQADCMIHLLSDLSVVQKDNVERMDIEMAFAEKSSLECSNKGITKGKGLMELCRILGISIEDTIAVGDADNDRDILLTAGLSIAMGNARESIKEICQVIVADNDHDGCAEAIYDYLLK